MTRDEWALLVTWTIARYGPDVWDAHQVEALGSDLRDHDVNDVAEALEHLYRAGRRPWPEQLMAATNQVAQRRAIERRSDQALPASTEPPLAAAEYRQQFHAGASWARILEEISNENNTQGEDR